MELQQLRSFLMVVHTKNITRAAEQLHISQPALSRQIHQLEATLGGPLFERFQGGVRLTDRGHYLVESAREMVALADKVTTNLNTTSPISGELYIGGGETQAMNEIVQTFGRLRDEHPAVTLRLFSGNGDDVLDRLDRGLLDFGIVIEPVEIATYASRRLSHQDQWGLLTRADSAIAAHPNLHLEQIHELPLLVSEQSLTPRHFDRLDFTKLHVVATYNLLYNASLLVRAGIGHALCLRGIITELPNDLRFIPLSPDVRSNVHLIWKDDRRLSNVAVAFLKQMDTPPAHR